ETILRNELQDRVSVYQSDCFDSIPKTEKWDLLVGNLPWRINSGDPDNLILTDTAGRVHRELFREAPSFLRQGGGVLLVESHEYTTSDHIFRFSKNTRCIPREYIPPPKFSRLFHSLREYEHLSVPGAMTLRLALFALELYFLHFEVLGSESEPTDS